MSKQKGDRNERELEEYYTQAGYRTDKCRGLRWGKTDWFGLFDLMAIAPNSKVRYIQVKTNAAQGINKWVSEACRVTPDEHVTLDFGVKYDYEGWRLIRAEDGEYRTIYDERDKDCNIGDGIKEFLRGERETENGE